MSALHKAMAFDGKVAGFVEKLGELERFNSGDHPPLPDLVVEVFEHMGVDPYPRIHPGAGAARTWLN